MITSVVAASLIQSAPKWIWSSGTPLAPRVCFRKCVDISEAVSHARISIACDDRYELFINGESLAQGRSWRLMQELDISRYLHRGRNVLAVDARNLEGPAGLLVQGEAAASHGRIDLDTNSSWKCSTADPVGWKSLDFDDSAWSQASVVGALGDAPWGQLESEQKMLAEMLSLKACSATVKRPAGRTSFDLAQNYRWPEAKTREFEAMRVKPVTITGLDAGRSMASAKTVMVDFGRELAGWVEVSLKAKQAPDLEIQVSESTMPQSEFATSVRKENGRFVYRLMPPGGYTGFRHAWIKFHSVPEPATDIKAAAVWKLFPVNYLGSFECSDPELNRIWLLGAYSVRLNMAPDVLGSILRSERTDRFPWMGDDRVAHRTLFSAFGAYDLAKADLEWFVKPREKNVQVNGIPGYTLDWIIGLHDYWMASGDTAEVRKYMTTVVSILHELSGPETPKGWMFTDWSLHMNETNPQTILAFRCKFVHAAGCAEVMAKAVKELDLAREAAALAAEEKAVIAGTGTVAQQHAFVNGVLSGVIAEPYPMSFPDHTQTPYFTYYVLEALSKTGQNQRALEAIRKEWGGMLALGATSTHEFFIQDWIKTLKPGQQPPDVRLGSDNFFVSFCHPWSSGATAWLTEHVLGVEALAPGYKKFRVRPFLGGLKWAKGTVPTPYGPIVVDWRLNNKGRAVVHVQAPRETAQTG